MTRLIGEYIPTAKNALVKDLYDRLGYARCGGNETDGIAVPSWISRPIRPLKTFVQAEAANRPGLIV